jgi:hypothetical protein
VPQTSGVLENEQPTTTRGSSATVATLRAIQRNALPAVDFGMPASRKYPMPPGDKAHAANAKARATQQVAAGNLSPSSKAKIDAKADRILGKQSGSQSNSLQPHGDMLHPSDRASFNKSRRRGRPPKKGR